MNLTVYADGYLTAGNKTFLATYGSNGIGEKIREGDGISPEGTWALRRAFYRADRLTTIPTTAGLPLEAMTPQLAWGDITGHPDYNKLVHLPQGRTLDESVCIDEYLWREDNVYDVVFVMGYNDNPVIDGKGCAIFFHIARPAYSPTAGCAAISLPDMLEITPHLTPDSTMTFTSQTLKGEPIRWPYKPPQLG